MKNKKSLDLSVRGTNQYKKKYKKVLLVGYGLPIAFLLLLLIKGTLVFAEWRSEYSFHVQNIFRIEPREKPLVSGMVREAEAKPVDPATLSTEDYICYKFGSACKMALAVSQAENGTRQCDRYGVNTDKSIDVGVFQINSVHLKKGWKLSELVDCHKNVDYAYEIYQAQGWAPWVAYQTGSYKRFLNQ